MVRKGYTRGEMRQRGFGPVEASCFDEAARKAEIPYVSLVPDSNQKTLTNEERESAIRIGGEYKHLLSLDDH